MTQTNGNIPVGVSTTIPTIYFVGFWLLIMVIGGLGYQVYNQSWSKGTISVEPSMLGPETSWQVEYTVNDESFLKTGSGEESWIVRGTPVYAKLNWLEPVDGYGINNCLVIYDGENVNPDHVSDYEHDLSCGSERYTLEVKRESSTLLNTALWSICFLGIIPYVAFTMSND